ncbi:hypothetical protein [Aeoliella sp.]|uniref:hypothetical protein n=1 Tax=Aeoliella sp. TaxID=2795800 RepID=UPI003CCBDA26
MRTLPILLLATFLTGCHTQPSSDRGEHPKLSEQAGMEFFNEISGELEIELSEPPERIAENLANEAATPEAKIVSLKLVAEWFEEDSSEFRPLTEEELNRTAYVGPTIKLGADSRNVVEHEAPNGESFTVRELLKAVEETERQERSNTEWFGGVDVHHVFFEGLYEENGVWWMSWGS